MVWSLQPPAFLIWSPPPPPLLPTILVIQLPLHYHNSTYQPTHFRDIIIQLLLLVSSCKNRQTHWLEQELGYTTFPPSLPPFSPSLPHFTFYVDILFYSFSPSSPRLPSPSPSLSSPSLLLPPPSSVPPDTQLLSFMHSQFTFFHQGYDLLREFDPFMKEVAGKVDTMRKDAAIVVKEMETRHSLVSPKNLDVCAQSQSNILHPNVFQIMPTPSNM